MPSTEEARHGVGVCEDCGTIQPVEVRPDDGIRATGNPVCDSDCCNCLPIRPHAFVRSVR